MTGRSENGDGHLHAECTQRSAFVGHRDRTPRVCRSQRHVVLWTRYRTDIPNLCAKSTAPLTDKHAGHLCTTRKARATRKTRAGFRSVEGMGHEVIANSARTARGQMLPQAAKAKVRHHPDHRGAFQAKTQPNPALNHQAG